MQFPQTKIRWRPFLHFVQHGCEERQDGGKGATVASRSHPWAPDNAKQWWTNPQKLHGPHHAAHYPEPLCSIAVLSTWLSSSLCTLVCPCFTPHSCFWSSTSFPPQVSTPLAVGHTNGAWTHCQWLFFFKQDMSSIGSGLSLLFSEQHLRLVVSFLQHQVLEVQLEGTGRGPAITAEDWVCRGWSWHLSTREREWKLLTYWGTLALSSWNHDPHH